MVTLSFEQASVGYGDKKVLRHVSLGVETGEVLGVVGPNGVGKSTLIKAASGILPPLEGRVLINGAVVPQAVQLPETFQALDVVLMGRTPYLGWLGREGASDHRTAFEAMERTGTLHLTDRLVGELSGGEQQRLMIARALAQTPEILLLDEPTAHLDLKHQDEVLKIVRSLASKGGLAVLLTLHDLNLVARFADRVALLSDGKVRRLGNPAEVLTPDELAAVYGVAIQVMDHPIHGTPLVLT
jgi:iron complex transport system ATP-binding protein